MHINSILVTKVLLLDIIIVISVSMFPFSTFIFFKIKIWAKLMVYITVSDGVLTVEDQYKKTLEEMEVLKDHLGEFVSQLLMFIYLLKSNRGSLDFNPSPLSMIYTLFI